MYLRCLLVALAVAAPTAASAQSSNTSSNSSSNNGVVRERIVDTYCGNGICTRSVDRNVYRDGSNRWSGSDGYNDHSRGDVNDRRFTRWALRNFDYNRNGRLNRRELNAATRAWRNR